VSVSCVSDFTFIIARFYLTGGTRENTSAQPSPESSSAQPSAQPSPIFSANPAAGPSLSPTVVDLSYDDGYEDRDPASKDEEMRARVEAVFWGQRYEDSIANALEANKRGAYALRKYDIALEQILKSRTKPGQGSNASPSDVKGKGKVSGPLAEAVNRKGKGRARDMSEGASDGKGKGKAREPSEDEAPFDAMDEEPALTHM
jgi:hypothetical protein